VILLITAGAYLALLAGLTDEKDPMRRDQENTSPTVGEITTSEKVEALITYPEPITLGEPFNVGTNWKYTRFTRVHFMTMKSTRQTLTSMYFLDMKSMLQLRYMRLQTFHLL
jgi:hypothetical protein